MDKLDARDRVKRALDRKARLARKLRKELQAKREEDELSPLRDYEEHYGHGCEWDKDESSDEEDTQGPAAANVNNGAVNVNILCQH